MPEIEIRPARSTDIPQLIALDHHYVTDHVWQMDVGTDRDAGQVTVQFRQMRLPRSVRLDYPYSPGALTEGWGRFSGLLVASLAEHLVGYACLSLDRQPGVAWVSDLVVDIALRRKGIGSGLVLAAAEWAIAVDCYGLVIEMQPRNFPAICLAGKLGFEFCGYNSNYYAPHETGIFFHKPL